MKIKFKNAKHTLIVSDIHLAVAQPENKKKPLWKKFNKKEYFVDEQFADLLHKACANLKKGVELILTGDIFDFDSVLTIPENPEFKISWLEKRRGLNSEEPKSLYKIDQIIKNHPIFMRALYDFIMAGNKAIFIIGNHDIELHWSSVQDHIVQELGLPESYKELIRFCSWFYISNSDTLVEHGNQYDPYCSVLNPINPFSRHMKKAFVRLPFGNLSHRYMINGMGVFNPHVDSTYLLTFWGYVRFYFNTIRTQPLLIFAWFFGAIVTLVISIRDGLAPRIKTPLTIEDQYRDIAENANADPGMVRALRELHAHPVSWNIFRILRVLWLDRAIVFSLIVYVALQVTAFLHILFQISLWWAFPMIVLLMPLFIIYAQKMETVKPASRAAISDKVIKLATQITNVSRLVCGHTHFPEKRMVNGVEYLNAGYWSPSFIDHECKIFDKNRSFVWIKPDSRNRSATVLFWDDCKDKPNPFE